MKDRRNWIYLRPALIVISISLLFASILVQVGNRYYTEMLALYTQKSSEYGDAETALTGVREDLEIIAGYQERFNVLERSHLFDNRQRIDWVDAVNSARRAMKLSLVRYQIAPQMPFSADYLPTEEPLQVTSSSVRLDAELLHEGDLVDLFHWMERSAPGQLYLTQCEMNRSGITLSYSPDQHNITLSCEFSWITLHPTDTMKEPTSDG
ncbi:MAG: hypothetical protein FD130_641 [Halothiobacillaceae bacterium]|nr:MAG: hypothetical protein FD130_641 [Halothiobacillaceae bacterium]